VKKEQKAQPGIVHYFTESVIVGNDVNTPDVEPLFANNFEVLASGTDIFLDIGIIDPTDLAKMMQAAQEKPGEVPTVRFSVLQRVAMSPATFGMLVNKVNATVEHMRGVAANAGQGPKNTK
jgi:hypothetical protein